MKISKFLLLALFSMFLTTSVSFACVEKAAIIKLDNLGLGLQDTGITVSRDNVTVGSVQMQDQKLAFVSEGQYISTFDSYTTTNYINYPQKNPNGLFDLHLVNRSITERQYVFNINVKDKTRTIHVTYKIDPSATDAPTEVSFFSPTKDKEVIVTGENCY